MNANLPNKDELPELSNNSEIKFNEIKLNEISQDYFIFHISKDQSLKNENKLSDSIKKSKAVIINQSDIDDLKILGFEQTLVIIDQPIEAIINEIKFINPNIKPFFLSEKISPENKIDLIFNTETQKLTSFIKNYNKQIDSYVCSCIAGYLIKKSYFCLTKDRTLQFVTDYETKYEPKKFMKNDYIELRNIGNGSSFTCTLIYHIKQGKLYVVKKPNGNNTEATKLAERELDNYKKVKHPFFPKFYGTTYINSKKCLVIEYIHGKTLDDINNLGLTFNEKLTIIFELMLSIEYLHENHMIYRDLKPNNIIIDENKNAVLIDLDNLIDAKSYNFSNTTKDLCSDYSAPEIRSKSEFSYKSDIYSLGLMIQLIMKKREIQSDKYSVIDQIIKKCTDKNADNRPGIFDLIKDFFKEFQSQIHLESSFTEFNNRFKFCKVSFINPLSLAIQYHYGLNVKPCIQKAIHYYSIASSQNDSEAQCRLGLLYLESELGTFNINKSIYYFSLAANQNNADAQIVLGIIYSEDKYVKRDINKAIHYFTLAANQNDSKAQFKLGLIYYEDKYVTRDINKAIHYLSLAANQNDPKAQFNLGFIYYEGKYVTRDINKALHYFTLAANKNNSNAQFKLGLIYYEDKYVTRDINKALHYFTLAANQNDPKAQFNLGLIYYNEKYIKRDINKAFHYFTLAANQNDPNAQILLGIIYKEGKYIRRDINKAIYYFSLAANQNDPDAQYSLGLIYSEGKYVPRDINKAIYYYSLSANQGIPYAQCNLGVIYHDEKYPIRNINKAIYYFSLAANQNYPDAQYNLGYIYYEGIYVTRDIRKAIYYLSLSANQNNPKAQNQLGIIYSEGLYVSRDINKAIYYYSLAANQNHPQAQCNLGIIYSEGLYVSRDISKTIYYFSLAADQNHPQAQFELGYIYYDGKYVAQDIKKAVYYYTLAARQNFPKAQFFLGMIYYKDEYFVKDINKSIYYLIQASNNGLKHANFIHGFLFHEGKYVERNIEKAIRYYKEASTFNNQFAKNNLGIIYKYGYGDKIKNNIGKAIEYFEEAIRQKNDILSMYNLASILIYDKTIKQDINKAIKLLFSSFEFLFYSRLLLSIIAIKQFGFDIKYIELKLKEIKGDVLTFEENLMIQIFIFCGKSYVEYLFEIFQKCGILYDVELKPVLVEDQQEIVEIKNAVKFQNVKDISQEFYNGFGSDLI